MEKRIRSLWFLLGLTCTRKQSRAKYRELTVGNTPTFRGEEVVLDLHLKQLPDETENRPVISEDWMKQIFLDRQINSQDTKGMKFDDILGFIGEMGPYQIVMLLLISLTIIPEAMNSMIYVFESAQVDHWCSVSEWSDAVKTCLELRDNREVYLQCMYKFRDTSIPNTEKDGLIVYSKCRKYDLEYPDEWSDNFLPANNTDLTLSCDEGWVYDHSQYISTTVTDFDLVCENNHLAGTTQSIFYFGYLVGAWSSGTLADLIGRYYTFFLALLVDVISGMVLSFSVNYWFFCLFRFIVGVSNISLYIMSFVIVTELVGPSKRVYSGILIPLAFAVGYMTLALVAFFVRDWRNLQRVASLSFLPFFLLIPIMPESPRWLMDRKDYEKAEKILQKIATFNKTLDKLPSNLTEKLRKGRKESEINSKKENTVVDIFKKPRMRIASVILFALWIVVILVYFTISLNAAKFGHNEYITFFLLGVVEVPASLLFYPMIESPLGRRLSVFGLMVASGIACLCGIVLSKGLLLTIVAAIGKFTISAALFIVYIFTAELFPTTVRSAGVGCCATVARIGSISSPIILIIGDAWIPFPYVVCGFLALVVASLVLLLPETRGVALPGTLQDAEDFLKRKRRQRDTEGSARNQPVPADGITNNAFVDSNAI